MLNTFHQHKNSGCSTGNSHYLHFVPPPSNVVLMQTTASEGLSNFIKRPKRHKRSKNKAFAVVGMRITGNTNNTEENNNDGQSELEDNIDKGMLLKPGEEMDSSENGDGSDSDALYDNPRPTPVLMVPK